jgi:hypothetical protein
MTDLETNHRMMVPETNHPMTDLETNILLTITTIMSPITITTVMTTNRIVVVTDVMEETDATGETEEMGEMEKMDETERTDVMEKMARMLVAKDTKKFEDPLDHAGAMGIPDAPVLLVLRAFKVKKEIREKPDLLVLKEIKAIRETRGIPEKWVQLVLREFRVKPVLLEAQDQPDTFPKHLSTLIPLHHKTFPPNNPLSMIRLVLWWAIVHISRSHRKYGYGNPGIII